MLNPTAYGHSKIRAFYQLDFAVPIPLANEYGTILLKK